MATSMVHGGPRGYSGVASNGVQGDLLQDFPLFVRTHAGKKHRIRNGTLQAAIYLVPSNSMDNSFKDDLSLVQKDNEQSKRLSQPSTVASGLKFQSWTLLWTRRSIRLRGIFFQTTSFLVAHASLSYRNINIGPGADRRPNRFGPRQKFQPKWHGQHVEKNFIFVARWKGYQRSKRSRHKSVN